jgi:KRAB domain-containing zinc finger protein
LKKHLGIHFGISKPKRFTCDRCGFRYFRKIDLINHLIRKPLKCSYCEKELSCKLLYDLHCIELHGAQRKSWPCETCKLIFPMVCLLTEHQKEVRHGKFASRNDEEHDCKRCSKSFNSRRKYLNHQFAVHKVKEARKCRKCCVTFLTAARLKAHLKNHKIIKTFKCPHCSFLTQKRANLTMHVKKHKKHE